MPLMCESEGMALSSHKKKERKIQIMECMAQNKTERVRSHKQSPGAGKNYSGGLEIQRHY